MSEKLNTTYLCMAWGETDFPAAAIVTNMDAVRAFLVEQWLGSADETDDDGVNLLDWALKDMREQWALEGEEWKWECTFEIGGVSVQRVGDFSTQRPARELESASQPGGGEAVKVEAVRANFTPFYIMSNVRRIVPACYNKQRANWVLAMDVFAVGSKSARQICWDADIDPDGYAIISVSNGAAPSAGNGGVEGDGNAA